MSEFLKLATITIDNIAQALYPKEGQPVRRYADILAELQEHLQNKGDDPTYSRVIFTVETEPRFVEIDWRHVSLNGVFPRYLAVRYEYTANKKVTIKNIMLTYICNTLIVADTEKIALVWEGTLGSIEYLMRRI